MSSLGQHHYRAIDALQLSGGRLHAEACAGGEALLALSPCRTSLHLLRRPAASQAPQQQGQQRLEDSGHGHAQVGIAWQGAMQLLQQCTPGSNRLSMLAQRGALPKGYRLGSG